MHKKYSSLIVVLFLATFSIQAHRPETQWGEIMNIQIFETDNGIELKAIAGNTEKPNATIYIHKKDNPAIASTHAEIFLHKSPEFSIDLDHNESEELLHRLLTMAKNARLFTRSIPSYDTSYWLRMQESVSCPNPPNSINAERIRTSPKKNLCNRLIDECNTRLLEVLIEEEYTPRELYQMLLISHPSEAHLNEVISALENISVQDKDKQVIIIPKEDL